MATKIIFLDIDGVLNSQNYYKLRVRGQLLEKCDKYPHAEIDREAVKHLNQIITDTGAKVVISSTWRHNHTAEQLQEILNHFGFRGEIIGETPVMRGDSIFRGNEIHKWLRDNENLLGCSASNYTDYVILDDDSDFLYWQRNNFIWIDSAVGLTINTAYKAARLLNRLPTGATAL